MCRLLFSIQVYVITLVFYNTKCNEAPQCRISTINKSCNIAHIKSTDFCMYKFVNLRKSPTMYYKADQSERSVSAIKIVDIDDFKFFKWKKVLYFRDDIFDAQSSYVHLKYSDLPFRRDKFEITDNFGFKNEWKVELLNEDMLAVLIKGSVYTTMKSAICIQNWKLSAPTEQSDSIKTGISSTDPSYSKEDTEIDTTTVSHEIGSTTEQTTKGKPETTTIQLSNDTSKNHYNKTARIHQEETHCEHFSIICWCIWISCFFVEIVILWVIGCVVKKVALKNMTDHSQVTFSDLNSRDDL